MTSPFEAKIMGKTNQNMETLYVSSLVLLRWNWWNDSSFGALFYRNISLTISLVSYRDVCVAQIHKNNEHFNLIGLSGSVYSLRLCNKLAKHHRIRYTKTDQPILCLGYVFVTCVLNFVRKLLRIRSEWYEKTYHRSESVRVGLVSVLFLFLFGVLEALKLLGLWKLVKRKWHIYCAQN